MGTVSYLFIKDNLVFVYLYKKKFKFKFEKNFLKKALEKA